MSTVFSAPHEPSPETNNSATSTPDESGKRKAEKDLSTLSVTPKQENTETRGSKVYFPYTQSLSARLGVGYFATVPSDPPDNDEALFYLFGIQYMMTSMTHRHWEIGVDIASESRAFLHASLKWVSTQTEKFRPFFKVGIAQRWDRADELESLVDYKSYSLRGTAGWELLTIDPASIRFDIELQIGADEVTGLCTLGYSWPW